MMMTETASFGGYTLFQQNIRFRPKLGFFRQLYFSFGVADKNLFGLCTKLTMIFVIPLSDQFCLGRWESGRIGWLTGQDGGTLQIGVNPTKVCDNQALPHEVANQVQDIYPRGKRKTEARHLKI